MELIATSRRDGQPVASVYGAAFTEDGRALTCDMLYVIRNQRPRVLILRDPQTKKRLRVRLPKTLIGRPGHTCTFSITLELLP